MKKVAIVTDTTACIPQEQVEKYSIEVVPMAFVFGDKVYRNGVDMSPTKFYSLLRQAEKLPTTSHPSPEHFLDAYRDASRRAPNILCITISSHFSATFNSAQLATEMAKTTLPNTVIEVLDCDTAAAAQGLIVLEAARVADSGGNLNEVKKTARNIMERVNLFATLDTLRYLVKGGRVPQAAALSFPTVAAHQKQPEYLPHLDYRMFFSAALGGWKNYVAGYKKLCLDLLSNPRYKTLCQLTRDRCGFPLPA
ncbi:hypothetical protein ES703_84073 [subsurface metagenome]